MEKLVPICTGLLAAISVAGLQRVGGPCGAPWRAPVARLRACAGEALASAREALASMEEMLEAHGVSTPRRRAEVARVERAMPDVFGGLAVSLGSGLSLGQAMQYVGSHAEGRVREELLHASALMSCGVSSAEALDELTDRLGAPGLDLVTLALKVSRRTGAPLAGLLAEAAHLVEARIELTRRLEVKTAQVRMSARMVAGMPFVMVAFLSVVSEDFRAGVMTAPGLGSLAAAALFNVLAWSIIRRVMKVEV